MSEDATNPDPAEALEVEVEEGVADEAEAQGEQSEAEDGEVEGDEPDAEAEDGEEIDLEGVKYKVPKAVKEAVLRQADYTRKTQEVAADRKALEAWQSRATQEVEAIKATVEDRVKLATIDQQLERIDAMDWAKYTQSYGADQAMAAMASAQALRNQRADLAAGIAGAEQELARSAEALESSAIAEAQQILARDIPGLNDGIDRHVTETAGRLGFSPEELRATLVGENGRADVRAYKAITYIAALEAKIAEYEGGAKKAKIAEKIAKVQPAKVLTPSAGQYKAGLNDDLPIDEWNRRRNAELAKRGRR